MARAQKSPRARPRQPDQAEAWSTIRRDVCFTYSCNWGQILQKRQKRLKPLAAGYNADKEAIVAKVMGKLAGSYQLIKAFNGKRGGNKRHQQQHQVDKSCPAQKAKCRTGQPIQLAQDGKAKHMLDNADNDRNDDVCNEEGQ